MKTVILNGQLGKLFGRKHRLDVGTAAEAVRALVANFPAFERHLIETPNVRYRVKASRQTVATVKDLHSPIGQDDTITFTPVIAGAGVELVLGAALIGASQLTALTAITLFGSVTLASVAFSVGVSLVLGGVAQLLAPSPKSGGPAERPENQPSYVFSGPVNTTAQGQPVPIGYGRLIVGGAVISAGLTTEEIPV